MTMIISLNLVAISFLLVSLLGMSRNPYLLGKFFWLYYGYLLKVAMVIVNTLMIYLLIGLNQIKTSYSFLLEKLTCGRIKKQVN